MVRETISVRWENVPLSTAVAELAPRVPLELYPGEQGLPYLNLRLDDTPLWDTLTLLAETTGYRLRFQAGTVALMAPERETEVLGKPIPLFVASSPLRRPFVQLLHTRVFSTNQVDLAFPRSDRAAADTLVRSKKGGWLLQTLAWHAETEGRLYALEALYRLDQETALAILNTQTNTVALEGGAVIPMSEAFRLTMEKPDPATEPGFSETQAAE